MVPYKDPTLIIIIIIIIIIIVIVIIIIIIIIFIEVLYDACCIICIWFHTLINND